MERMQKVLFLGDSEVGILDRMREQLRQCYNVDLYISCNPSAKILTLGQHLTHFQKTNGPVDQIYIFGLTCSIWKKISLTPEDGSPQVITWNSASNLSFVPVQMDAITRVAAKFNPTVRVYLVIPTMKDIASFNEAFLNRQGRSDLIPSLEQQPHLQRAFLNLKAREMFGKTVELQGTNQPWFRKQTFSMKSVFDSYYNKKDQGNPHHQFWMGRSDRLNALDLCNDGLHYTEAAFDEMFAILSLTNFKRRTQDYRPAATTTTPTTTTTTSVIVEEVESVPGPSGIQRRIEYRHSQPRTIPSTNKIQTKGKSETRVYYSRAFVDSMGLGEQPSTSFESSQLHDGRKTNEQKGAFPDCPLTTSTAKKSSKTETLPPASSTASTSKSKVKRLQRPANRRRKMRRRAVRQQESNKQSTGNKPSTSMPTISSEFTTFATVQTLKIWKFAKEKSISKEIALQELIRVFNQVSEMAPQ
ncbi:UNVERIFIED_CONTAM: hypothetical protein RMT77_017986 [Armadillidium vulgare]